MSVAVPSSRRARAQVDLFLDEASRAQIAPSAERCDDVVLAGLRVAVVVAEQPLAGREHAFVEFSGACEVDLLGERFGEVAFC